MLPEIHVLPETLFTMHWERHARHKCPVLRSYRTCLTFGWHHTTAHPSHNHCVPFICTIAIVSKEQRRVFVSMWSCTLLHANSFLLLLDVLIPEWSVEDVRTIFKAQGVIQIVCMQLFLLPCMQVEIWHFCVYCIAHLGQGHDPSSIHRAKSCNQANCWTFYVPSIRNNFVKLWLTNFQTGSRKYEQSKWVLWKFSHYWTHWPTLILRWWCTFLWSSQFMFLWTNIARVQLQHATWIWWNILNSFTCIEMEALLYGLFKRQ